MCLQGALGRNCAGTFEAPHPLPSAPMAPTQPLCAPPEPQTWLPPSPPPDPDLNLALTARAAGLKQAPAAALQAARTEASRVYSALLDAVCGAMRERVVERADQIVAISRCVRVQRAAGRRVRRDA